MYDKPWRDGGSMANHIYRPSKDIDKEMYGAEDLEKAIRTSRLVVVCMISTWPLQESTPISNS